MELTYKTPTGKVANELLYRHDEPRLELVEQDRPWSFDGDGALFRLVSEAQTGVPDQAVRTVTENSRTLKFTDQGFERE